MICYVIFFIEPNPCSLKRKHSSNFNSGNDNKLVVLLGKIFIFYVHAMFDEICLIK